MEIYLKNTCVFLYVSKNPCTFAKPKEKEQGNMKRYEIFRKKGWQFAKFDGRRKEFKGLSKEEFVEAQNRWAERKKRRDFGPSEPGKLRIFYIIENLIERAGTEYEKVIIEGNRHLYIASPVFLHKDYNKSIFAENTPSNRKKAELINRMLLKKNR